MRKFTLIICALVLCQISIAQNIFPTLTSGGVGVGTTSPQHGYLHINGEGSSAGINLWTNSGSMTSRIWIDSPNKLLHISRGSDPLNGITLNNDGKLGIGTINPTALLELKGPDEEWVYVNPGTVGGIRIGSSTSGRLNVLYRSKSTDLLTLRNGMDSGELAFIVGGSATERMRINSDGNIGIGTNDPKNGLLHINGEGVEKGINLWTNTGSLTSRIWVDSPNKLLHITRGNVAERGLTMDNEGNVSIGTTNNGPHKFAVEGSIGAREVKVQATGWSDFVFDSDYDLPTLNQVKSFIDENGHLPEIPSAIDVEENGINLGEMDAKLLQKIEELTLYQIQLLQQLTEQNNEIQKLKLQVTDLQSKEY